MGCCTSQAVTSCFVAAFVYGFIKKLYTIKKVQQKTIKPLLYILRNYFSSATNGNNAIIRETLIADVSLRWYLAEVPVTRRGKILPRSEMNFFKRSTSL